MALSIHSTDFPDGERIPVRCTGDGENDLPSLTIDGVPQSAVELALICHDPDAPGRGGFTHWTAYGLAPGTAQVAVADYREGPNDAGEPGWYGPKPPAGHGTHHYTFTVYALSRAVDGSPNRAEFLRSYANAVLEQASLIGTYSR
ncbi:YbhB/YbcL family Raf kinase inhibitor-like protein [Mycetocola sp. 2940]|uniref:YbhB/YbcL family Raf kinase inhibitor-like protein n=1 Tax=Mycetocola sp. 2940 TaxID=3156452 RepID=UPI00339A4CEA